MRVPNVFPGLAGQPYAGVTFPVGSYEPVLAPKPDQTQAKSEICREIITKSFLFRFYFVSRWPSTRIGVSKSAVSAAISTIVNL